MNGLLEGNGRASQSWVPMTDVWETENELVYAFDLPGIPEDKISVELDDDTLTVTAERERGQKVEDRRYFRFERRPRYAAASASLIRSAIDCSSIRCPVTSSRISSAVGFCPSDQSSRNRPPASRRVNHAVPNFSRR
jgi:hypothetical protein